MDIKKNRVHVHTRPCQYNLSPWLELSTLLLQKSVKYIRIWNFYTIQAITYFLNLNLTINIELITRSLELLELEIFDANLLLRNLQML